MLYDHKTLEKTDSSSSSKPAQHRRKSSHPAVNPTQQPAWTKATGAHPPGAVASQTTATTAGAQPVSARHKATHEKKTKDEQQGSIRLQTALDSQITTQKVGAGAYMVTLHLKEGKTEHEIPVAQYESRVNVDLPAWQLPIYIEDVVAGGRALVQIKYDPQQVVLHILQEGSEMLCGYLVQVRATQVPADQLLLKKDIKIRSIGKTGFTVEGREKVTSHLSSSDIDKVIASVASAEGGFASVEASDEGVFTWGQGQWTVTGGELQTVLAFIKKRRPDLWDKYWGQAGLEVQDTSKAAPVFVFRGRTFKTNKTDMLTLFRPNRDQNRFWVGIFAQAAMDPQIQRLQREFMRNEAQADLRKPVEGASPEKWLNLRGRAFFYSMHKNASKYAREFFKDALASAGGSKGGGTVSESMKKTVSDALENIFKNASIVAWQSIPGDKHHHVLGFWGEGGKKSALAHVEQRINHPKSGDPWTKAQWEAHKTRLQHRQSRYEKTKADIDAALNRKEVEPDVPPDAQKEDL